MRILIDTNIIVSAALFPKGKVAFVLAHLFDFHTVVIASYSIEESKKVFLNKFPEKLNVLDSFYNEIEFELFETPEEIDPEVFPKIRDVHDLPILASAILSDVDVLITGDKDFEGINLAKPLIFTPSEYFEFIE